MKTQRCSGKSQRNQEDCTENVVGVVLMAEIYNSCSFFLYSRNPFTAPHSPSPVHENITVFTVLLAQSAQSTVKKTAQSAQSAQSASKHSQEDCTENVVGTHDIPHAVIPCVYPTYCMPAQLYSYSGSPVPSCKPK